MSAFFAPALMTREIAAAYLSISERALDKLRADGHITARKLGADGVRPYYSRVDLDEYVAGLPENHPERD